MSIGINGHKKAHGVLCGIGGDVVEPCRDRRLGDVEVGTHYKQGAPGNLDPNGRTVTLLELWYRGRISPRRDK